MTLAFNSGFINQYTSISSQTYRKNWIISIYFIVTLTCFFFYLQRPCRCDHQACKSCEQFWHLVTLILISFQHLKQQHPFREHQPKAKSVSLAWLPFFFLKKKMISTYSTGTLSDSLRSILYLEQMTIRRKNS